MSQHPSPSKTVQLNLSTFGSPYFLTIVALYVASLITANLLALKTLEVAP